VQIRGDARQITGAINAFSHAYHADFSEVRAIGRQYLAEATPKDSIVVDLARTLRCVLACWGAGQREAPELRGAAEFVTVLRQPEIRASLAALALTPLPALTVVQQRRYLNGNPATPQELAVFESYLFGVLRALGKRLLIGNTNATYPMKAVLLITGLMPAFDSQVRCGLQRGGFVGMNQTQFLLPTNASRADGKKVARLPFLLGECWAACAVKLHKAIAKSDFPELISEPGRVFDVLLFVQGDENKPVLVTCDPPGLGWYNLE
jgi:hypothetical protein